MNQKNKKIFIAVGCTLAAILLFFAGFFTYYLTLDEGLRSLLWYKDKIQSEYYEDISDDEFWNAAIGGAEGLLDEYSALYSADEYDEVVSSSKGQRLGIGASFFANTNLIYKVAINSPAFFAGVEAGTYVTGIGASDSEFEPTFTAAALSMQMARYDKGDTFYIRVSAAASDDTRTNSVYAVKKGVYTESFAIYSTNSDSFALIEGESGIKWERCGDGMSQLENDTAYIRLVQFYGNAAESVANAVAQFQQDGKSKLILDLRNNGGGSVDVMRSISSYFLKNADSKKNIVMTAEYKNGKKEKYYSKNNYYDDFLKDSSVYVMANHNSASASEALIGAMISYGTVSFSDIFVSRIQDNCRTYGKGIMQTTFSNIITGEAAKLTTAKIYWPNGKCIHGTGISLADNVTPVDTSAAIVYGDPELEWVCSQIK